MDRSVGLVAAGRGVPARHGLQVVRPGSPSSFWMRSFPHAPSASVRRSFPVPCYRPAPRATGVVCRGRTSFVSTDRCRCELASCELGWERSSPSGGDSRDSRAIEQSTRSDCDTRRPDLTVTGGGPGSSPHHSAERQAVRRGRHVIPLVRCTFSSGRVILVGGQTSEGAVVGVRSTGWVLQQPFCRVRVLG